LLGILQDFGPYFVAFTQHDGVDMRQRLIGIRRNVDAAHNNFHVSPLKLIRNLVGAPNGNGRRSERYQVYWLFEIKRLHYLVYQTHVVFAGC
jgi:hypothetical protein